MSALRMAKLWLIRALLRFSINGLFVRFVVELLFDESCVFDDAAGESVVVDDGDKGAAPIFTEFALFVEELELVSRFIRNSFVL